MPHLEKTYSHEVEPTGCKVIQLLDRSTIENKLIVIKAIIKIVWPYGVQLWVTARASNLEIVQRFQNKILRAIAGYRGIFPMNHSPEIYKYKFKKKQCARTKYVKRLETHPGNWP